MTLEQTIKQRAAALGFDDCRIANANAPTTARHLQDWLRRGCHGRMGYLERNAQKRVAPSLVLSGVRSVITVATNYYDEPPRQDRAARRLGRVARYARYTDYHDVMGANLKKLTEFVDEIGGGRPARSLWYVDTGPVLEREFAQRAGIGFVGKHTNLISRRFGNWILLGEILSSLELTPDTPETNRCGSCSRCIAACPTGAITAPFQLDARRCISYLTIELKGAIPVELRPAIGDRVFGCDDCLEVCPWNRFARASGAMREQARPEFSRLDLEALLRLNDQEFKQRFVGTPIMRSKRRGLLRNACVALGNIGDKQSLSALRQASRDREPLIVEHAAWAIARIQSSEQPS